MNSVVFKFKDKKTLQSLMAILTRTSTITFTATTVRRILTDEDKAQLNAESVSKKNDLWDRLRAFKRTIQNRLLYHEERGTIPYFDEYHIKIDFPETESVADHLGEQLSLFLRNNLEVQTLHFYARTRCNFDRLGICYIVSARHYIKLDLIDLTVPPDELLQVLENWKSIIKKSITEIP